MSERDAIVAAMDRIAKQGIPDGFGVARHYHVIHPRSAMGFPVKAVRGLVTGETAYDFNAVQAKLWLETRGFFVADNRLNMSRSFQGEVETASARTSQERQALLPETAAPCPFDVVLVTRYRRNANVVAERLHLADGFCDDCGRNAPFVNAKTGAPFLEVHHIVPLADGGPDILENTQALCPNCLRKAHHG